MAPNNAVAVLVLFLLSADGKAGRAKRMQRTAAFDLLRLERQQLATASGSEMAGTRSMRDMPRVEPDNNEHGVSSGAGGKRDQLNGEEGEDLCRRGCNEQLRMGLDMVKAHSAFGSIGVPSVVDSLDLHLFCRLDATHDSCLLGGLCGCMIFCPFRCGYEVQFNMRDFVCKRRRDEFVSHLECYVRAAPQLRRQCEVCGPHRELELSLAGVGQRCRALLCDLACARPVLAAQPRCREAGVPAAHFLQLYSQIQVLAWLRELLAGTSSRPGSPFWRQMPRSCTRLVCGANSTENCVLPDQFS